MASEGSELPEFPMVSRKRKRVSPDNIEETDQSRYDYTSEISESSSNYDAQDSLEEPDNELGKAQLDSVDDVELDPSEQEPEQGEVLWSEDREQYPEQPAYHEDIKGHKDRLIQILDELVDRFSTISGKSEAAKMLHAELCKLRVFPKPKVPVIALLGDSGTGALCVQGWRNCTLSDLYHRQKRACQRYSRYTTRGERGIEIPCESLNHTRLMKRPGKFRKCLHERDHRILQRVPRSDEKASCKG